MGYNVLCFQKSLIVNFAFDRSDSNIILLESYRYDFDDMNILYDEWDSILDYSCEDLYNYIKKDPTWIPAL